MSAEMEALIAEARDPSTPLDRLLKLMGRPEVKVKRALLDNPNVCPSDDSGKFDTTLLKALAREFSEEVAAHPLFVLHALIEPNDEFRVVIIEVAKRTKEVGLIEQLLRIWGPSWSKVRLVVALNPMTSVDVLRTLGNQQSEFDEDVREAVAWNPSTPEDVLRILGNQQTESIAWARVTVATNPKAPEDVLRTLANPATESDEDVRKVAQKVLAYRGLT